MVKRKYCENVQETPPRLINLSIHNRKTHFSGIYCKTRKPGNILPPYGSWGRAGHRRQMADTLKYIELVIVSDNTAFSILLTFTFALHLNR